MSDWIKTAYGNAINLNLCIKILKVKNSNSIDLIAYFNQGGSQIIESFDLREEDLANRWIDILTVQRWTSH